LVSIRLETDEPIAAISISCPAARPPDTLVEPMAVWSATPQPRSAGG